MKLEGKVVAITGAYSGLGAALSEALAKKGCKLVLGGRNKQKLDTFTSKINKFTDVEKVIIDVRNEKDCENFVDATNKKFGKLDMIINNAGIWNKESIGEVTETSLREMFETNVFGVIYCSKFAAEEMKKRYEGMIVNIASTAGVDFKPGMTAYGTSKHAVVGFTGALNEELKGSGIDVICFCPGGIKTNLYRSEPDKIIDDYMEPSFVAEHLINQIENPSGEWLIILRRPK